MHDNLRLKQINNEHISVFFFSLLCVTNMYAIKSLLFYFSKHIGGKKRGFVNGDKLLERAARR